MFTYGKFSFVFLRRRYCHNIPSVANSNKTLSKPLQKHYHIAQHSADRLDLCQGFSVNAFIFKSKILSPKSAPFVQSLSCLLLFIDFDLIIERYSICVRTIVDLPRVSTNRIAVDANMVQYRSLIPGSVMYYCCHMIIRYNQVFPSAVE